MNDSKKLHLTACILNPINYCCIECGGTIESLIESDCNYAISTGASYVMWSGAGAL